MKMKIKDYLATKVLEMLPTQAVFIEAASRRGTSGGKDIIGEMVTEAHQPIVFSIEDWQTAIAAATDPREPDRSLLANVYRSCELDTVWQTATENIILKLQGLSYHMLNEKGEEDEAATALIQRPWFFDFVRAAAATVHTGTKVINLSRLTPDMELDSVSTIPMTHLIPSKKRILKDPAQRSSGWDYSEPPLSRYYVQLGNDHDLGILEKLAPIILFKKKAIGHWLDYMNRYGVPPAWVITDRQDDTRFNELWNMMKNMGSSRFAVLRGKEEIKIQQVPGTDAYRVFKEFIDKMGDFIMQCVAGATGTMDEKAFVGAAKVHQDTFEDRMWFYRQFIINAFNKEVKPRLAQISPVYASFDRLRLAINLSEELSVEDTIKYATMLAQQFTLDPQEISRKTGFTIIGQRGSESSPTVSEKKKPERAIAAEQLSVEIAAFYSNTPQCGGCGAPLWGGPQAVELGGWGKVIDRIAQDLHSGRTKPEDLNKDYILKTGNALAKGVDEGWGSTTYNPADVAAKAKLKRSAYIFASAKNAAFQQELANELRDDDGKLRSFNDFKKIVLDKDKTYNQTYLQAEYQTAVASSLAAKKWVGFERRADRYPNLEYRTVRDGHVRDEHRALHGTIRPIRHSFWNLYYPPNGWRCRCYVAQTDRKPNGDTVPTPDEKTVPKYFRVNSGKTGNALPAGHPYFNALAGGMPVLPDDVIKAIPFEKVKTYANGSELYIHPFHDRHDDGQMLKNLATANLIAKAEKCIIKLLPTYQNRKSPEFLKNGVYGDRSECTGWKSIRNVYSGSNAKFSKGGQLYALDDAFVVFDFNDTMLSAKEIILTARYLNGKMRQKTTNTFNYILFKDRITRIDRDMGFEAMETAINALWAN